MNPQLLIAGMSVKLIFDESRTDALVARVFLGRLITDKLPPR